MVLEDGSVPNVFDPICRVGMFWAGTVPESKRTLLWKSRVKGSAAHYDHVLLVVPLLGDDNHPEDKVVCQ
jgi:hypothetical protein